MKTLKGKIIAGIIAVAVLMGTGAVFANTNAGAVLKGWYDGLFNSKVETVKDDVTDYRSEKFNDDYDDIKKDAKDAINDQRDSEIDNSGSSINDVKDSYLKSLSNKETQILSNVQNKLKDIYNAQKADIDQISSQNKTDSETTLKSYADTAGQKAVDQVKNDLNATKETAISEVKKAIDQTKGNLISELDKHSKKTTEDLKDYIDTEIQDLHEELSSLTKGLVEQRQGLISAKAQEIENNAKAKLDQIVSGINN